MADETRELTFSQRMGIKPVRTVLQVGSMDDALRNGLWNLFLVNVWNRIGTARDAYTLTRDVWSEHLNEPLDTVPYPPANFVAALRERYFSRQWNEAYDFIEYIASHPAMRNVAPLFTSSLNDVLDRQCSGYRFVKKTFVPITSEEEIAAIETALALADKYRPVRIHLKSALDKLADRDKPDPRNSIKESISAVEAMCRIVTGDDKATLGQAVKKLEDSGVKVHKAFQDALSKMYGYTSDADGIRHALLEESTLDADDARFMLVSCSAFVNYLKAKSAKTSQ